MQSNTTQDRRKLVPATPSGVRGWWKTHGYILPSIIGVTLVFVWFVTFGTWRLFENEDDHCSFADRFFNAQAVSLLQGRLDVPKETIEYEAFLHNDKFYGYFGIATSLLRVPLFLLFPGTETRWNRPVAAVACIINLVCAYLILRVARKLFLTDREPSTSEKWLYTLFVIVVGLGSSNIYMGSRSFIYHEPIIWGGAFALLFYYFFLRYLITPTARLLLIACVCSILTMLTRAPQGGGTLVCLGLFAVIGILAGGNRPAGFSILDYFGTLRGPQTRFHACLASAAIAVAIGSYSLVNYAKYETVSGMPLHLYARYQWFNEQHVYDRVEGKVFHLSNARTLLYNYFWPDKIKFSRRFPYVYATQDAKIFPEAKMDLWGEFSSFPASKPALLFLSLFGVYAAFFTWSAGRKKKFRLPLLGAAVAGGLNFFLLALSERYLHDFYPFLILAGAAGLHQILALKSAFVRTGACIILVALSLYSIYVNTAFALVHQREISTIYGSPWAGLKEEEFKRWREAIDSWVWGRRE
jgi:hypothetical protein